MKKTTENNHKITLWLIRILIFVSAVFILAYFFPRQGKTFMAFEEGRPWAHSLLTAPFDFPVYKDDAVLQQERDSILSTFEPVYIVNKEISSQMTDEFEKKLNEYTGINISQTQKEQYLQSLREIYSKGIISSENQSQLKADKKSGIRLLENNVTQNKSIEELHTPKSAYESIMSQYGDNFSRHILQSSNINEYLTANLLYDSITSNKIREELLQQIVPSEGMIQAGERIIDRGEIVTPELYRILTSYETALSKRNDINPHQEKYIIAGKVIVFGAIMLLMYFFLAFFRPRLWRNTRAISLIILLIVVASTAAFIVSSRGLYSIYYVPLTIVPIIVVTFFDSRTAMYAHLITTIISSFAAPLPIQYFFMQLAAGMATIDSLNNLSKRSQLFRCSVIVFAVYALTYVGYILFNEGNINEISTHMLIILLINSSLVLFSYLLIYIFERLFGFMSSVTLVELSDINSPLLQQLSEEAPGTFQHAMQVSNLAAAAAHHVGANAQLVRTGALYHDIGKLMNPSFFTENQSGADSPHKNLDLVESARIIISHVNDGLKMAEKQGLPMQIQEFIATHHGHGKAKYFYTTYCNQHPDEEVDESKFTYPGHNPQSKETGIMMMADAVEAASRSLKEYNHEAISQLVSRIIDAQISEGLLKDTPLSFRDVETIKETFTDKLMTIYHTRIAYPTLNAKKEVKAEEKK